ncbi:gliding motility-associated ABC transporter substrate-binding protein GldG [Bacteroidota bacterium]
MVEQRKNNSSLSAIKKQSLIRTVVLIVAIILINIISTYRFFRIDLTQDKRYTLGEPTIDLLKSLDDKVYVKVYLEGDLPAGFRKLKESTRELLDEMRRLTGTVIDYDFIDPLVKGTAEEQNEVYKQLIQMGLEPVNLEVQADDQKTEKIIFPGAVVFYKNRQIAFSLLKQQLGIPPDQVIHNSIVSLEYAISNTIRKLAVDTKSRIAFIEGHGELNEKETQDMFKTLSEYFEVERIDLPSYKVGILDKFDLAIIAKPRTPFTKLEQYKIDQFVVKGGKVIWLVESLLAEMDSLTETGYTTTIDYDLDLTQLWFHYGIKLNYNLVQDLQCHLIPVLIDQGSPQQDFRPWVYFPVVFPESAHPIVNNLNACMFRFCSSLDTVNTPGIKKTVLLTSSPESRLVYNPVRISLADAEINPEEGFLSKGPQPLMVLVEGAFESVYKNRLSPATLQSGNYGEFQEKGEASKIIFISDGDVIANQVSRIRNQIYPLGYDRYTNQTFGNKDLMLNAVDYLLDDSGIMKLRSKQFKLRLLDKAEVKNNKFKWQLINMVMPVILILLFGLIYYTIRKRKFAK